MKVANIVAGLIVMVISVIFFILSLQLPPSAVEGTPGAGYFPLLVSIFLFISGLILVWSSYRKAIKKKIEFRGSVIQVAKAMVIIILAPFLISLFGFVVAMVVISFLLLYILEVRVSHSILLSCIMSLFIYYIFRYGLNVYLPSGILF